MATTINAPNTTGPFTNRADLHPQPLVIDWVSGDSDLADTNETTPTKYQTPRPDGLGRRLLNWLTRPWPAAASPSDFVLHAVDPDHHIRSIQR